MDAVRVSDGKFVALKKASKSRNPDEVHILKLFSSEPSANEPANHCVPMLDVLDVPNEENLIIIVMPLLRRHNNPWFSNIGEAVECIRQLFEVRFLCLLSSKSLPLKTIGNAIYAQQQSSTPVNIVFLIGLFNL